LPPGGAQRVALTLAERLDRSRFDVHLVSGPRGDWVERAKNIDGCTYHPADHLIREIRPMHDMKVIPQLALTFKRIMANTGVKRAIVHTHAPKAGLAGRWAAKLAGCMAVHTLHGLPFNANQSFARRSAYRLFESAGYLAGGELISVTETNLKWALEEGLANPSHSRVIPPSVDMHKLHPRADKRSFLTQYGITEDDLVIGFVASLKPPKDPQTLMKAFAQVVSALPHAKLVIAGGGEMSEDVEQLATQLGIERNVILTGWLDPVEPLYPELDLLVLPTHSEGLPLVLIEARACGVPVIATNVGGIHEIIEHDVTGLLVKDCDVSDLATAMIRVLTNPEFKQMLIANGLQNLDAYHPDQMVGEHEALFIEMAIRAGLDI